MIRPSPTMIDQYGAYEVWEDGDGRFSVRYALARFDTRDLARGYAMDLADPVGLPSPKAFPPEPAPQSMLPDPSRRYVEFTLEIRRNGVTEERSLPSLDALDRAWREAVAEMPDAEFIHAGTTHLHAGHQRIGDRHARYFRGVAERRPADGAELEPYEVPAPQAQGRAA